MKKQFGLPLMLASVLAFSACSSEDVPSNGIKDINALTDGGYVKMNISLPTRSANSVRANDQFYDGLADEYKVNDATLILFQGDNEDEARFHSAYNISKNFTMENPADNQITSTEQLVKSVKGESVGANLYALVVLNKNNVIAPQTDHTLQVNGKDFFGSFAELKKTLVAGNVAAFNGDGFFMTNAPLANVAGGQNNPAAATFQTLVNINNAVYSTKAEAEENPAADIYVERGVAKVTILAKAKTQLTDEVYAEANQNDAVSYEIDAWGLDITNNSSYFAHITSTDWNGLKSEYKTPDDYRFIGFTAVETGKSLYRSYWGEDPNYSDAPADAFKLLAQQPEASATVDYDKLYTQFGEEKPLYCMENTFNVANQNQDRSTRVIVRAKLTTNSINGDFYTVNNTKSTIYTKENIVKMLQKAIFDNSDVKAAIGSNALNAADIDVTLSAADAKTNQVFLKDFDLKIASVNIPDATKTGIIAAVNAQVPNIILYKDGYAYYPIIIKHFGNDQTPWNVTSTPVYPITGAGQDANYLGRYGVLRNNWYELEVNSIRTIGSATIPERKDTPDDELNSYISVTINILSWAKRSQKEDL